VGSPDPAAATSCVGGCGPRLGPPSSECAPGPVPGFFLRSPPPGHFGSGRGPGEKIGSFFWVLSLRRTPTRGRGGGPSPRLCGPRWGGCGPAARRHRGGGGGGAPPAGRDGPPAPANGGGELLLQPRPRPPPRYRRRGRGVAAPAPHRPESTTCMSDLAEGLAEEFVCFHHLVPTSPTPPFSFQQ